MERKVIKLKDTRLQLLNTSLIKLKNRTSVSWMEWMRIKFIWKRRIEKLN